MTISRSRTKSLRSLIAAVLLCFGSSSVTAGELFTGHENCVKIKEMADEITGTKKRTYIGGEYHVYYQLTDGLPPGDLTRRYKRLVEGLVAMVYRDYSPAEIQLLCLRATTSGKGN